jgi:hypothetical protein
VWCIQAIPPEGKRSGSPRRGVLPNLSRSTWRWILRIAWKLMRLRCVPQFPPRKRPGGLSRERRGLGLAKQSTMVAV